MKRTKTETHKQIRYTLTLTADINGGSKNMNTGRVAGDVLGGQLRCPEGYPVQDRHEAENFMWYTGNHNENSTIPIAGHILKKHTVTTVTSTSEEEEIL